MAQQGTQVKSVVKAMELLSCFAKANRPLSLQELAGYTGWAKSTIHGLLSAMRPYRVIEQSRLDGKYRLGIRLFELGSVVSFGWNVIALARPYMQNIAMQIGESVHIGMLDGGEVLYLDHVDNGMPMRIVAEKGARLPAHCTALGKIMLAYLHQGGLQSALQQCGMQSFTPHTIVEANAMKDELESARANGFAIENGEYRVGMRSVAAPIFDVTGNAPFAIGVTGMFRQIGSEQFQLAKRLVVDAAEAISAEMGYGGR